MEVISAVIFYLTASLAIFGAIGVIFTHKIVYALIYVFLTFLCVGFLFLSLELPYLGVAQIVLSLAVCSVLLLAALMFCRHNNNEGIAFRPRLLLSAFSLAFIGFLIIVSLKYGTFFDAKLKEVASIVVMPSSQAIATEMFVNYGAAFVFTAFAFLAGIIGFGVFAQPVRRGKK